MQNKKILIAGGVLVALLATVAFLASRRADQRTGGARTAEFSLPDLEGDAITEFTVHRGEEDPITLRRSGEGEDATWNVVAPLDAEADGSAVSAAIQKLDQLEMTEVVARNASNHARLDVDDASGVRVVVKAGDDEVADLVFGSASGGVTMVRPYGQDVVVGATGSLRYAFDRALSSWRNKRVLDIAPERVVGMRFTSTPEPSDDPDAGPAPTGPLTREFTRSADGEWSVAGEVSEAGDAPVIERFSSTRTQAVAATLARLRATDFAATDIDAAAAGFDAPSAQVTLTVGPEPEAPAEASDGGTPEPAAAPTGPTETIVLELGSAAPADGQIYLRRVGGDTIYTVSRYSADRMRVDDSLFQDPEPGSAPPTPPGGPGALGAPGMDGMGGPGGGQIPPELMRQIQEQMRQQGLQ